MVKTELPALAELYELDETAWLEVMVELIEQRRLQELDLVNLEEFLDSMAKSDRRKVENRLELLLAHLLKWEHQPERRSKSWRSTIRTQRRRLVKLIASGTLRKHAEDSLAEVYAGAIERAADDTGLPEDKFPADVPFTLDEALTKDFFD
jgi:hypothetical protein